MRREVLLGINAVILGGCATAYSPPVDGPKATLINVRATNQLMFSGGQAYTAYSDEYCKETLGQLAALSWASPDPKANTIPAESRFFVRVYTLGVKGLSGNDEIITSTCTNMISFVPRDGATYEMSHELASGKCYVRLTDKALSATPSSIRHHDVSGNCKPR